MDVQLKRGMLEVCVLKLLQKKPSYGYQLTRDLPAFLGITESTLYPILRRLETSNMVKVHSVEHNGRLRKYYQINDQGEARIALFLHQWKAVMQIYNYIAEGEHNK